MKIVPLNGQMTFEEMKGSLELLPKTNRWVQMGDALPWAAYEKVYNEHLNNETIGDSNKPGRMAIAALIIKHKLGLSDDETILAIQENPYMQYMCGLTEYTDKPSLSHTAMPASPAWLCGLIMPYIPGVALCLLQATILNGYAVGFG